MIGPFLKAGLIFSFVMGLGVPAFAQEKAADPVAPTAPAADTIIPAQSNLKAPDVSNIAFIQNLRRIGATLYYMGESLGMHGWLAVKDKQMQVIYTSTDNRAVMIGALISPDGANISQQQILLLAGNHPEISEILKSGQGATIQLAAPRDDDAKPTPAELNSKDPPSEQLYAALEKATQINFGKPEAPHLFMIMDVYCQYCQETWKLLAPYVDSGKLHITMIPIGALGAQSMSDAANWLGKADPLDAWRKHVAGDATILKTGTLDPVKEKAVADNTALVRKWGVEKTPYFFYRGLNGKVRLVLGQPQSVPDMIADIGK